MTSADVVIAGGGIVGLATALELQAAGRSVIVFDRGEAMCEASRAAAGMLAGNDPENPAELRNLAQLSLRLYPEFLAGVEDLSGVRVPIRTTQTLQGLRALPTGSAPLNEAAIEELAPGINTGGWKFQLIEENSFDAWDLAEALPRAVRAAGVVLREHTPVLSARGGKCAVQVDTSAGLFSAGAFLNATGAWAPALDAGLPVFPRKGHMLTAELPGERQTSCVLRTGKVYIVPRGNNRYTVGPTVEDAGFDKKIYPERVHTLFQKAAELWPRLGEGRIAESWVGLRPGSEDGLPIIDMIGEHCWVATGHFKNGIMLAPGTARVLAQWIGGEQPELNVSAFRSGRFADVIANRA